LIEVRQDLISDAAGVAAWAERLAPILAELNAMPALHAYQRYPSRTGA
jgi:predicted N-formylglutamate amidohydrolase